MGKLILVRHGETAKNVGNSLHSVDDPETLNEIGESQINQTATKLKEYSPSKIYSSKEKRALQSAEIISKLLGVSMQPIDGMQERNWGVFTGKPWSEVKVVLDPITLDERYNYVPQNGESWKVFETRLVDTIKKITKDNLDETVVILTHGGAIRALMPFLLGVPKEESFKYDPANAALTIFDFDGNRFTEIAINDTSHLSSN